MSTNTITCPHCKHEIELSEALSHQMREEIVSETRSALLEEAQKKASAQFETQTKSLSAEIAEEKERNKSLTEKLDKLLEEMRALRRKDEEREIEMKQRLLNEEEKIRVEIRKKTEAEHELKDLEKNKKLSDALIQIEELKNKMQQGSQQTQGEVLELELERILKNEFPSDKIYEVKKGERGADTTHEIIDKLGRSCGVILWESKNAQWQQGWISKLKGDQRTAKSELAVLVTINKPEWLDSFTYREGVWVTSWQFVVPLAFALRFNLISLHHEKQTKEGKSGKMEVVYEYLIGTEFKHRVEAIVEAFSNLQAEMEREKRWFAAKWGRQEKEIRKVLDHTHGMYGDLQGIVGASLPELKSLSLESGESSDEDEQSSIL